MVAIRFGSFTLDTETRELVGESGPVHLSPKAFALLEYLVRERPRAVPKNELLDVIWSDVHVEEQNVKNLVVEIRKATGDDASAPRFIRNVFGRGYAFCGEAWEATSERGVIRGHLVSGEVNRAYPVRDGENLIGRDPDCSIVLEVSGVSRRHASITIAGEQVVLEDLGSKNGTSVNGERVGEPVEIGEGDAIRIGRAALTFRKVGEDESTSTIIED